MPNIDLDQRRTVIPRWRELSATPSSELASSQHARAVKSTKKFDQALERAVADWKSTPSLVNALEVVDAVSLVGLKPEAEEALAMAARADSSLIPELRKRMGQPGRKIELADTVEDCRRAIQDKKRILRDQPRNTIAHVEIARRYAILGQSRQASKHLDAALRLSPDNRYTLRSAARFFVHADDPDAALFYLRRSASINRDPWVMAAEVAVSDGVGQTPKSGIGEINKLISTRNLSRHYSELCSALGALERSTGSHRRSRKLISKSLDNPTENAFAQATWIAIADKRPLPAQQGDLMDGAFEAGVFLELDRHNFKQADQFAWSWLADEPFSTRASVYGSYISCTFTRNYERALKFADRGLLANPDDPGILNNKVYALIMLGRLAEARDLLPKAGEPSEVSKRYMFDAALNGLYHFRIGNLELGRKLYSDVAKKCFQRHRTLYPSVVANWIENEVRCGAVNEESFRHLARIIDENIRKIKVDSTIWKVTKAYIEAALFDDRKTMQIAHPETGLMVDLIFK